MGEVILVTGGAKSGKSLFAEQLAGALGSFIVYVATAEAHDAEMVARVARHRARRPATWFTVEAARDLRSALKTVPSTADAVLVDCLTIWASNHLLALAEPDTAGWWTAVEGLQATLCDEMGTIIDVAHAASWHLVMVTNEVGYGVVPETPLGRAFRDLLGALTQRAATLSDAVFLVVAGLGTEIKRAAVDAGEYARTVRPPARSQPVTVNGDEMDRILEVARRIGPLDAQAMVAARERQDSLTKPQGSLGRLEALSVALAGITGKSRPRFPRKAVFVCAADHGVAADGVSAYPQEVTAQMVLNFVQGGAAINVLARRVGARVVVADLGVVGDLPPDIAIERRKIARGTQNFVKGPAMSGDQARAAVCVGIDLVEAELLRGLDLVATGDMGIGNTTASSAIAAAITGRPVAEVTGRGTGVDDSGLQRKVAAIERALAVNQVIGSAPLDVLAKVGGFEIGALVGVILAAASHRLPVVIDGFISGAAALIATELCPQVRDYLIAAHSSVEIGHRAMLERMGLAPLLNLDLRLGEGTGAAMAMHLIDDAVAVLDEMATFADAGVSEKGTEQEARDTEGHRGGPVA